ncbi:MAG: thioredoxin family protein [Rhodobacterales bacterium]|nr:thioredoxin family protein [Rhodobacterales bacterium]
MAAIPPVCDFGWQAKNFELPGVDGEHYSLDNVRGNNGMLIMFICNHCPYVLAVLDRIVRDAEELQGLGVGVAAISSNDVIAYPEDSFENMIKLSKDNDFSFPYLYDEDQNVAKSFDAVCTPDFFGFNSKNELQYRGRLDASRKESGPSDLRRDLFEGMKLVAETGKGPTDQVASMGCSIKWKQSVET